MQYADYALWQRELLQGDRLRKHLDYWLRQLGDAAVNTQIDMTPFGTVVKRASSGSFTSDDVSGVMIYESIVPDEFVLDTSVDTGPFTGELLVTASDGSSLRLVAVDEFTVRFDIDLDGDSIVDHDITCTVTARREAQSAFGDDNVAAVEASIRVLEERMDEDEIEVTIQYPSCLIGPGFTGIVVSAGNDSVGQRDHQ